MTTSRIATILTTGILVVGAYIAGGAHADAQWRTYVPDHVTTVCADADCWPLPQDRP